VSSEYIDTLRNQDIKSFDALPGFKKRQKRVKIKEASYHFDSDAKEIVVDQSYSDFKGMIYNHESMARAVDNIQKLATSNYNVFITGETGTGKEFVAHSMHELSEVKDKNRFISVNCAAIPDNLIESELFGYEKGAFTGANDLKLGFIEMADGGTLFLDEIHTISVIAQHKLFRYFTDSSIIRLGSTRENPVTVRVISASSKDLTNEDVRVDETVDDQFYYRIAQTNIKIPAVKDRGYDFFILLTNYLRTDPESREEHDYEIRIGRLIDLAYHKWPGNVREIQNFCRQQISGQNKYFDANDLPFLYFKDLNQLLDQLQKDEFSEDEITRLIQNSGKYVPVEELYKYMIDSIRTIPLNQTPKQLVKFILSFISPNEQTDIRVTKKQALIVNVDNHSPYSELEKSFLLEVLKSRYQKYKTQEKVAKSLGVGRATINNWQNKIGMSTLEIKKLPKTDIISSGCDTTPLNLIPMPQLRASTTAH
jgi:transcriptional regulator with PAS, ATPase and Fis domain